MTTPETDRILDRVRKMLALANDRGATEGERDNALRMAHATLAKYNLDIAQLEATAKRKTPGEDRVANVTTFYGRPWARAVCSAVADLFFCSYLYMPATKAKDTRHYFVGRHSNSVTAGLVAAFVVESITREGKRRSRQLGLGNEWFRSFAWGAAGKILQRVREIREQAEREKSQGPPGTALVLASVYATEKGENTAFIASRFGGTTRGRSGKRDIDPGGVIAGVEYGKTISLNPQVR